MANETSEALEIHQFMNDRNVVMSFMGELTHQVTTSLLKNLKLDMNLANVDVLTQKRLYGIIVECLDNISKHWKANDIVRVMGKASPPIFMLSRTDGYYYIITGNHIPSDQIDFLVKKIELVNSLDKKGLQDFYRVTLAKESPLDRDNAGLGIIDIKMKSGNNLEYEFRPVTPTVSFYVIQARIQL
jgi:hypothetical protein